jgi:hypothetical protein
MRQILMAALLGLAASAACAGEAGKLIFVAGAAQVAGKPALQGSVVNEGDTLATGGDGYIYVKTADNGLFILRPNSQARIAAYHIDRINPANTRVKFELQKGVARSQSGEGVKQARQNFRFNTPVAAIGVRGTDFTVFTDDTTSRVAVLSGGITISGFGGGCSPEGSGPCEGDSARDLTAAQKGQLLQIRKGQAAQLLQGNGALAPDVVAPPRNDEPVARAGTPGASMAEPSLDPKKDVTLQERAQQLASVPPTQPNPGGGTGSGVMPPPVVETDDPSTDPVPPVVSPDPPYVVLREVTWGRWQPVLNKAANATLEKAGATRLAYNNFYVLFRENGGDGWVPPQTGSVGFALAQSEAVIYNQVSNSTSAASVQNGKLQVNFGTSSFTTSLDLKTNGEKFSLVSEGTIAKDGRLYGNSILNYPTNMTVEGAVQSDSKATYLFQAPLSQQRTASGVTVWSR